jgi:hypothetical protein
MIKTITNTETIYRDDSGIIKCIVHKDAFMQLDDVIENIDAVRALAPKLPVPVFVDIRMSKGATRDARAFLANDQIAEVQCACALLVESALSQLIGNFFLGLNKTKFPVKLFKNETKALEWLKTFL